MVCCVMERECGGMLYGGVVVCSVVVQWCVIIVISWYAPGVQWWCANVVLWWSDVVVWWLAVWWCSGV